MAENKSTLRQKVREAIACWYILLRDKYLRHGRGGSQVTNCLQLKKGTRFRLSGGEVQLLEDDLGDRRVKSSSSQAIIQTAATRGSAPSNFPPAGAGGTCTRSFPDAGGRRGRVDASKQLPLIAQID